MKKRKTPIKFLPLFAIIAFLGGYLTGKQDLQRLDWSAAHPIAEHAIKVRFSPNEACVALIKEAINLAQKQILVHAYSFTSAEIVQELIKAHNRGIQVKILVDRSQLRARGSQVDVVKGHNISIKIDRVSGIAHNKVMIIDDMHVLTGSFNWSQAAATSNAENLLLITDKEINQLYTANWIERAKHAEVIP